MGSEWAGPGWAVGGRCQMCQPLVNTLSMSLHLSHWLPGEDCKWQMHIDTVVGTFLPTTPPLSFFPTLHSLGVL